MSIERCEYHSRRYDTDFVPMCPLCESDSSDPGNYPMNARIPDPSDHPSFYDPDFGRPDLSVYANTVQRVIEERAEQEIEENATPFYEWIVANKQLCDLAQIASLAYCVVTRGRYAENEGERLRELLAEIRKDYTDSRVEDADRDGTWQEIATEAHNDALEARQAVLEDR